VTIALKSAMKLEGVQNNGYADLLWLIAQESEGKVDVRNQKGSSARGLFQLLEMNWHWNPNGEKSFGNATEECQGGIRYIKHSRHRTAARAVEYWKQHRHY